MLDNLKYHVDIYLEIKRMRYWKEVRKTFRIGWSGPNCSLALFQLELHCCIQADKRRVGGVWAEEQLLLQRNSWPTPPLGMLASRILTPSLGCWPRFFSSASEARDALAHVSEGEKKPKGLDRNRVSLVHLPE